MRIGIGIGISRARRAGSKGPVNTVAPEVTGTAERGELLTCSTGTWTGTGSITYAYQWNRGGAPIAGATSNTYTLVAADDNLLITCAVTATDDEGSSVALSNAVGPVLGAPFNLAAPEVTGTETVGQTLSVTTGTWQGVATITFAYQWRRDGSNISGATSSTYTLVAADYGTVIDCVVTATNSIGSTDADSNNTGAIAGIAPVNTVAPSISGSTGLGDTLTRVAGTWTGTPTPAVTGQWRRDGVAISGETGATYDIALADSGAVIDYLETATNAEGTATADSNNITVQTFAAPTIGAGLSIAGTEEVGETLTATPAAATGNPSPVRTWQWQRSADGSTGWADISGATSSTYVLDAADETNYVRVKQIETNALGSDEAVSAATGQIQAGGATGILDSYTGAAFAFAPDVLIYSAHSVTDSAVGSATEGLTGQYTVRVRRSSDNAVSSFTYTEVSDGTLTTWVGAGNDGFVEAGFDQGVNGNHATQGTAANQPKVVDAGSLVVENGKAALDFDGSNDYLTAANVALQHPTTIFSTQSTSFTSGENTVGYFSFTGTTSGMYGVIDFGGFFRIRTGSTIITDDTASLNENYILTTLFNSINSKIYRNSNETASGDIGTGVGTGFEIGAWGRSVTSLYYGYFAQIFVLYNSDQSANRTAIETAINNEYNIY